MLLREIDVLVLDCQATGATPVHGDLLELGWAVCGAERFAVPARAHWIVPRTDRGVSRAVRKLTGWDDDCLAESVDAAHAFQLLHADASLARDEARGSVPTVIHFARFELPFLRELHAHAAHAADAEQPFPFDTVCLHAIAQRLFPDLPRRNLRALAGHLGHSPELIRRATGHVEASAFIWQALLPVLEKAGARTWDELKRWLEAPAPASSTRKGRPAYPLTAERRRALPDAPGVYRFLRPNGDVLYVGKAASLKKRVASHFTTKARATERALEMLTQAHDVRVTTTATALEAALLETDEIKRLDPPYNVQLRAGDRQAWFASRDWQTTVPAPDDEHRVGPLPSRAALSGIAAVRALLEGAEATDALRAAAVGVPRAFAPDAATFDEVWRAFVAEHLAAEGEAAVPPARTRILRAAAHIVIEDDDDQDLDPDAEAPPSGWDRDRARRYLERTVVHEGRLVRRARALSLLSSAVVVFRETRMKGARALVLERGHVIAARDVAGVSVLASPGSPAAPGAPAAPGSPPERRPPSRHARQAVFDATLYDRLRVLVTELRRVAEQGGDVAFRLGRRQTRV